jgi:SAM-dependent methyltransferase
MEYYDKMAPTFIQDTLEVDMSFAIKRFLTHVPDGGAILDAGCGSGRDSKTFSDNGYFVTAFDASHSMVRFASKHSGVPVKHLQFQEIRWDNKFDGIWCCASLLHIPAIDLQPTLRLIYQAMKVGSICYMSFKYGQGERLDQGRIFNDQTESTLNDALSNFGSLELIDIWKSSDVRPERSSEFWLNAITRKTQ